VRHHGGVSGIYDDPELYQIACAYRDIPAEVDALLEWASMHWEAPDAGGPSDAGPPAEPSLAAGPCAERSPAAGPSRVLELAAGPAEHALELARRGLRCTTLDISPAMCRWATDRAGRDGLALEVVQADMRDFKLDSGPMDLAITMLNSACHLFTLDDMIAHLGAVARALLPGGLYVVELAHPADYLGESARTSSEWTVEQDGITADIRWGGPPDAIDPVTQVTREEVNITARYADGTTRTVTDVVPNRFWTATEITAAIRLAGGFTVAATYGDFDHTTPVDAPDAWRLILVLRRDA
jgi:SAM-dependent methyltransferase